MTPRHMASIAANSPQWWRIFACAMVACVLLLASSAAEAQGKKKRGGKGKKAAPAQTEPRHAEPSDPTQGDVSPAAPDEPTDDGGAQVKTKGKKGKKTQVFDFTGLQLSGSERKPQLLYFLDRANEELQRAALKRRSFIPEMIKSLDEEAL